MGVILTKEREVMDYNNSKRKVKGVADIVFLIDATGSMQGCIDGLKENLSTFFDCLTNKGNQVVVKDWRAKVVGFRDYEEDGRDDWYENAPFVREVDELKKQLSNLVARGGGDTPETQLDAIYVTGTMGTTEKGESPDPYKWRYRSEAARIIVLMTDSEYKPYLFSLSDDGSPKGNLKDVINLINNERLVLSIFAPDLDCYKELSSVDRAEYIPVEGEGLDELTTEKDSFNEVLKQLAQTVSQSSETTKL